MTGRLVDMAFTLGGKQRVTLEINGDFREIWDKLHQEPVLDVEIKKHREKRSLSANAYFHVLWTAQSKKPRNWASRRIPRNSWLVTKKNGQNDRKGKIMNTYGARPEVIAIPVDEYKELLAANTELKIIYHKLESCAITTEKYTFHEFVQNMHDALHSVELDAEAPAPVIPGMVEPLAAMHAQGAERLTDAEQL